MQSARFRQIHLAVCLAAGLLPIVTVHFAYWLNLQHGLEGCNPYWDGCLSVSRAVRSGPGLAWFKALAVPIAACLVITWWSWPRPPATRLIAWTGALGAVFFLVYAGALGTDGELYKWMRRYGVVFYFGLTGLAQLLLARRYRLHRASLFGANGAPVSVRVFHLVLGLTWATGVMSAFKRRLTDDPTLVDRLENALEWGFSLGLSAVFLVLALVIYQSIERHG